MSEQAHVDAILALLNEALAPKRAYEVDGVPSPRPAEYVEVQIARVDAGDLPMLDGTKATEGYRLTVYGISQTHAANARLMLEKCRGAIEFQHLNVGAGTTTPIQFEVGDPVTPDDGWFSGWADYVYQIA